MERASKSSDPTKISIYYMHGCLRFDRHANDPDKESDKLVCTEQQYFDFFNDPTGHFSYTFLYLPQRTPAVLRDERRTAGTAGGRRLAHDAGRSTRKAESKSRRHFAILKRGGRTHLDDLTEQSLSRLGTTALWVDDHGEIRERLQRMYEGGSASRVDWGLVY